MGYFAFAFILAAIGGINFNFGLLKMKPSVYWKQYAVQFLIVFVPSLFVAYSWLPPLVGPFWGLAVPLALCLVFNLVVAFLASSDSQQYYRVKNITFKNSYAFPALGFLILVLGRGCAGSEVFTADERRAMIGEVQTVENGEDLAPIDLSHIRMTSREQAIWALDKVLGEADKAIGSRFHVGEPTLQRLGTEFLWVAPLEYNGWRHWTTNNGTPGYVTVSAVDARASAKLVTKQGDKDLCLTYVPSAYFGDQLERFVYERGYKFHTLYDYHFELDDEHHPWWVMTLTEPTEQYSVEKISMVLLIDPQTGKITEYQLGDLPTWVDRAMPDDLAEEYLTWWGHFVDGWWNSFFTKDAITEPTRDVAGDDPTSETLTLVYGAEGEAYWFTGMTSTSSSNQSLVSYVLVNSRTGVTREFRMSGPCETAIIQSVNSAVSDFEGWHATTPVPYHLYGETAWVVPVLSSSHIFQKVAVVRGSSAEVALGADKQSALRDFQRLLTKSGNNVTPAAESSMKRQTLVVERFNGDVQNGSTVYQIWSSSVPNFIFTGTSQVGADLPLTMVGDEVEVGYMETTERVVPMSTFSVKTRAGQR